MVRNIIVAIVACILGAVGGYMVKSAKPATVEFKDRTVTETVTIKPDGTHTTTTVYKDVLKEKDVPVAKFSVGGQASAGADLKPSYKVMGGYRLLGNLWGEAGYDMGRKEATVGVRLEF
jgi:hypothetical protein